MKVGNEEEITICQGDQEGGLRFHVHLETLIERGRTMNDDLAMLK